MEVRRDEGNAVNAVFSDCAPRLSQHESLVSLCISEHLPSVDKGR